MQRERSTYTDRAIDTLKNHKVIAVIVILTSTITAAGAAISAIDTIADKLSFIFRSKILFTEGDREKGEKDPLPPTSASQLAILAEDFKNSGRDLLVLTGYVGAERNGEDPTSRAKAATRHIRDQLEAIGVPASKVRVVGSCDKSGSVYEANPILVEGVRVEARFIDNIKIINSYSGDEDVLQVKENVSCSFRLMQ